MKRIRMLLRVSSDQQLEADGDLSIQRKILIEYIQRHEDWILDPKEYFEGSKSAYKNTASQREVLQEILEDARKKEFDILVPYKDDRVGRLMWDTPLYIMSLKGLGVDVYTVKDGCISPEADDIMGQMMLTFRYANAQKSSADTGMRVKDTAQKLVEQGKFMGGKAPFGYRLDYSGEVSKHGRALKHLVIVPEQAELVQYMYRLSLNKEFGSAKIAKELNMHAKYRDLAPGGVWKSGTITSILTNPIYAGYTAYKRRERIQGKYRRLDAKDWILAKEADKSIQLIEPDIWNRVQEKRKMRGHKYIEKLADKDVTVIHKNDGTLPLIDVLYCGYCGSKLTNGSRYNYWTIKSTGEKRASKIGTYKCQNAWQGVPHDKTYQFRADEIEPVIFSAIAEYIGKLQENEDVFQEIERNQNREKSILEKEMRKEQAEADKIRQKIHVMEENIPNAMTGEYALSLDELVTLIRKQKEALEQQQEVIKEKELAFQNVSVSVNDWEELKEKIPTWQEVFLNADTEAKRVLVNRLIRKIEVKKEEITVHFKINLDEFLLQPRITDDSGTTRYIRDLR
ncbi:MAG TPA: recombinase family protein [Candidatus Blautia stercorigallinarum]|uniref:Recombinase family protein n=1 Tax=Candidatus Blautia stercorigallinarum TaxID=2838501 RepID=A0A9D1TF34_9FIRM|nr:recombinase family protein [Candidatus Blautia stercorigallinarum]